MYCEILCISYGRLNGRLSSYPSQRDAEDCASKIERIRFNEIHFRAQGDTDYGWRLIHQPNRNRQALQRRIDFIIYIISSCFVRISSPMSAGKPQIGRSDKRVAG